MQVIQEVKKLHQELQKPEKSHKYKQIIEELSEYFLYGDHQKEEIFDYFAEQNILNLFYQKLKSANHQLTIFIIERLSMIITNLQNPLNLNYVLSNPVLHEFINYNYDFKNPEIVDYYVNFLKTIAIVENDIILYLINFRRFYVNFIQLSISELIEKIFIFILISDIVHSLYCGRLKSLLTIQMIQLRTLSKIQFQVYQNVYYCRIFIIVSSEPKSEKQTESVIFHQTKIMVQFKLYLNSSPFILVYC